MGSNSEVQELVYKCANVQRDATKSQVNSYSGTRHGKGAQKQVVVHITVSLELIPSPPSLWHQRESALWWQPRTSQLL